MAEASKAELKKEQVKFESDQLGALNALHAANPNELDLADPRVVALISVEVRDRIIGTPPDYQDALLPNHQLLFQTAVARERKEHPSEVAFKRAFRIVYGQFMLEEAEELTKVDVHSLMRKALKNPIESTGLKGRYELTAVMTELQAAKSNGLDINDIVEVALTPKKRPDAVQKLERAHNSAKGVQKKIRTCVDYFATNDNISKVNDAHGAFAASMQDYTAPAAGSTFNEERKAASTELSILKSQLEKQRDHTQEIERQVRDERRIHDEKASRVPRQADTDEDPVIIVVSDANFESEVRKAKNAAPQVQRGEAQKQPKLAQIPFDEDAVRAKIKTRFDADWQNARGRLRDLERTFETFNNIYAKAKSAHVELKLLVDNIERAQKLGIEFKDLSGADTVPADFRAFDVDSGSFDPQKFLEFSEKLFKYFSDHTKLNALQSLFDRKLAKSDERVTETKKDFDIAIRDLDKTRNLADHVVAKRVLSEIILRRNPDASLEERERLASLILMDRIAILQNTEGYEAVAKRGSANLLDTANQIGLKEKLIGFKYEEGGKAVEPFKGLKPAEFATWPAIEKLFGTRLNHQTGFFLLAALEIFDGDTRSEQSIKTEAKLRELLAKQLGVATRMDESGIQRIVSEAYTAQLEAARPLVRRYFEHYDRNSTTWNGNRVRELNLRYEALREKFRLKKVTKSFYEFQMKKLVKEASDAGVFDQVSFSQASVVAEYWDSPQAQAIKDWGYGLGKFAGQKTGRLALGSLRFLGRGALSTTKLGLGLGVQTALLPLRATKYPLMLAAKPFVGFINLFRRNKWTPFSIRETARADLKRVGQYFTTTAKTTGDTMKKDAGVVGEEWGKAKREETPYGKRTKKDIGMLEAEAKEVGEKGVATPVEVSNSPFIDLEAYKKKIAELDAILKASSQGGAGTGAAAAAA